MGLNHRGTRPRIRRAPRKRLDAFYLIPRIIGYALLTLLSVVTAALSVYELKCRAASRGWRDTPVGVVAQRKSMPVAALKAVG